MICVIFDAVKSFCCKTAQAVHRHSAHPLIIALKVLEVALLLLLARLSLGGRCRCGLLLLALSLLLLEAVGLEAAWTAAVALHRPAVH
jgi:hypothetical protein